MIPGAAVKKAEKPAFDRHGPSAEEVQSAKEFRKNALKGDGKAFADDLHRTTNR